ELLGGRANQDWDNLKADWSTSVLDQTQRLVVSAVHALPSWNRRGILGKTLGGWDHSVVLYRCASGADFDRIFPQGSSPRPNWTGVSAKLENPPRTCSTYRNSRNQPVPLRQRSPDPERRAYRWREEWRLQPQ